MRENFVHAIRILAPTTALIRIFPPDRAVTHFFDDTFFQLLIESDVKREATWLIRQRFDNVADWRNAHDFHIPSQCLYRTPEPFQKGYVPEDDMSFGMTPHRLVALAGDGYR